MGLNGANAKCDSNDVNVGLNKENKTAKRGRKQRVNRGHDTKKVARLWSAIPGHARFLFLAMYIIFGVSTDIQNHLLGTNVDF